MPKGGKRSSSRVNRLEADIYHITKQIYFYMYQAHPTDNNVYLKCAVDNGFNYVQNKMLVVFLSVREMRKQKHKHMKIL